MGYNRQEFCAFIRAEFKSLDKGDAGTQFNFYDSLPETLQFGGCRHNELVILFSQSLSRLAYLRLITGFSHKLTDMFTVSLRLGSQVVEFCRYKDMGIDFYKVSLIPAVFSSLTKTGLITLPDYSKAPIMGMRI